MHCSNCGVCCTETEMLLSKKDINRLEKKGFSKNQFANYDKQGYAQLKNRGGYCIFYDLKNRQCSVYVDRPAGCRVYPVIVDEENRIILDNICQSRKSITQSEKNLKGKRVIKLLEIIDSEALERCTWKVSLWLLVCRGCLFALPTRYLYVLLSINFFSWNQACSYQFATEIANKLYFRNALVVLENLNGQKLLAFFRSLILRKKVLYVFFHSAIGFTGLFFWHLHESFRLLLYTCILFVAKVESPSVLYGTL